jgi:hypothetical protein
MEIVNLLLADDEYYAQLTKKTTIYLHHTAGGSNPINTINGWDKDATSTGAPLHVATSYVMGGKDTRTGDEKYNGIIYKAFEDKFWAHHLGTTRLNNLILNKQSIGIELCNYGPLKKGKDGQLYTYVNSIVPALQSTQLKETFKGFNIYHRYTDKQLFALKELLHDIAERHSIDLKAGLANAIRLKGPAKAFDINIDACNGMPGIWTHVNVLETKFDCFPQQELIDMLLSL